MITEQERLKIEEAKGYPLSVPDYSYIFIEAKAYEVKKFNRNVIGESYIINEREEQVKLCSFLKEKGLPLDSVEKPRTPVLAYGANASDIQLASKFKSFNNVVIPVIKATLVNFDIVFTPYFCYDGSIPATIQYSPGTEAIVAVTYLTEEQLEHMHKTESVGEDYNYIRLFNIKLQLDDKKLENEVFCYNSLHGCFYAEENHIAMKSIKTINRKFKTMDEEELLYMVKNRLGIEKSLDEFILDNLNNKGLRDEYSWSIQSMSVGFRYKDWEVIEG